MIDVRDDGDVSELVCGHWRRTGSPEPLAAQPTSAFSAFKIRYIGNAPTFYGVFVVTKGGVLGVTKPKWLGAALSALVIAALAAGCGGSVQSDDEPTVTREDFPLAAGTAYCRALAPCCAPSGFTADQAACAASWAASFETILSQRTGLYDPSAAKRCLDALAHAGATCLKESLNTPEMDDACIPLITPDPSSWVGSTHGALGDECSATCERGECYADAKAPETQCYLAEHLVCGRSGTCELAAGSGQACTGERLCERGWVCRSGTCVEAPSEGPCNETDDCATGASCVSGQCELVSVANDFTCPGPR